MILQDVDIGNKFTLHDYFSFTAVWGCIRPNSGPYRNSLERFIAAGSERVDQEIKRALEYLETKESDSSEAKTAHVPQAIKSFLQDARIDMDALKKELYVFVPDFIPGFWERNAESLKALIRREDMSFTPAAANLLYLFLLLHIQARRDIGEAKKDQEVLGVMKDMLASVAVKEGKLEVAHAAAIRIPAGSGQLTLPYRSATTEGALELVPIENASGENTSVMLDGTVLRRTLGSGKRLYALRKGGAYMGYLPRLTASERWFLTVDDNRLRRLGDDAEKDYDAGPGMRIAAWAYDASLGYFLVGEDGAVFSRSQEYVPSIDKKAVLASTYADIYAILLEDGSLESNDDGIKAWDHMVFVSVGLNGAMGIREDGTLVATRGVHAPRDEGRRPLAAYSYNEHWICMDALGKGWADLWEPYWCPACGAICAIGICEKGYIVGTANGVFLVPFASSAEWKTLFQVPEIEELAVSDEIITCLDRNGKFSRYDFSRNTLVDISLKDKCAG